MKLDEPIVGKKPRISCVRYVHTLTTISAQK